MHSHPSYCMFVCTWRQRGVGGLCLYCQQNSIDWGSHPEQHSSIHMERLTLPVDRLSSTSNTFLFFSPLSAFHRPGWRTCGLVCPTQLLLLPLLHDECNGSHLHPKAEINLAYNTPPVWQARLRKMSVSTKARTTAARLNILPPHLHPPILDCPVGLLCSSSRPVVREDRDL